MTISKNVLSPLVLNTRAFFNGPRTASEPPRTLENRSSRSASIVQSTTSQSWQLLLDTVQEPTSSILNPDDDWTWLEAHDQLGAKYEDCRLARGAFVVQERSEGNELLFREHGSHIPALYE